MALFYCYCDCPQTIQECLLLLRKLMEAWLRLLQEQRLASSSLNQDKDTSSTSSSLSSRAAGQKQRQHQHSGSKGDAAQLNMRSSKEAPAASAGVASGGTASAISSSLALDVHRLEGVLFMLLCSYNENIRCDAYAILSLTRLLHQELHAIAEQLGLRIGSTVLQQQPLLAGLAALQPSGVAAGGGGGAAPGLGPAAGGSFTSAASSSAAIAQDSSVGASAAGPAASSSTSLQLAASGNSGSGVGFFFRHKPSMSRESFEFMQTLGEFCNATGREDWETADHTTHF